MEAFSPFVGHWEGFLLLPTREVEVVVDFWDNEAGVGAIMDLPGQNRSLRLANVRLGSPIVHFEAIGGPFEATRIYDGELTGNTILGESVQSGERAQFSLTQIKADQETVVLEPGLNSLLFDHGGLTRRLLVRLPEAFRQDMAYPVVFFFQGSLATAEGFYRLVAASSVDMEEFIAVFPDPFWPMWGECPRPEQPGGPCEDVKKEHGAENAPDVDDVGFTEAILDWLVLQVTVDQSRVYATGGSAGGFIANQLGLHSDRFAAIATYLRYFLEGPNNGFNGITAVSPSNSR